MGTRDEGEAEQQSAAARRSLLLRVAFVAVTASLVIGLPLLEFHHRTLMSDYLRGTRHCMACEGWQSQCPAATCSGCKAGPVTVPYYLPAAPANDDSSTTGTTSSKLNRVARAAQQPTPTYNQAVSNYWAAQRVIVREQMQLMRLFYTEGLGASKRHNPGRPMDTWLTLHPVWQCPDAERIGFVGDGGKWVCGARRLRRSDSDNCLVYSFGSNGETSFEQSIHRLSQCEVHAFDPTLSQQILDHVQKSDFLTFHPWGLSDGRISDINPEREAEQRTASAATVVTRSGVPDKAPAMPVMSLRQTMGRLGHTRLDLLKIDIEGYEWVALLRDVLAERAPPLDYVGQLLVEVHVANNQKWDYLWQLMERMWDNHFVLFFLEINALAPSCAELAFVRVDELFEE